MENVFHRVCFLFCCLIIVFVFSVGCFVTLVWSQERVIFSDDFEGGNLSRWDEDSVRDKPHRLRLTTDPEHVYRGKYAVEMLSQVGKETGIGSKLNKWFLPGYDQVYVRWYCKFAPDFDQGDLMHFVHLLANRLDNKYSAFGKAGIKPKGDDFYTTCIEPYRDWGRNPAPGEMTFYSYHLDMPIDPKMNKYWGQSFRPKVKFIPERGRWYCMEMMMKANTPGQADGEQAFWIDGEMKGHFTGIRWRTTGALKINCFWLLLYIHDSPKVNHIWFDEVVISQDRIGPLDDKSGTPVKSRQ